MLQFAVIAENDEVDGRRQAATAGSPSSAVNVTVRVLDANDHHPVIVVPLSTAANGSRDAVLDVCGRARRGDRLLRIVAGDLDSGRNARLRYALLTDHDTERDATASSSSSSSSYFNMVDADDGWIVARTDLGQLSVGQTFRVTVVVTDSGRPPLSSNRTVMLKVSHEGGCIAAAASAGGAEDGGGAGWRLVAAVVLTVVVLLLVVAVVVVVVVLTLAARAGRRGKLDVGGGVAAGAAAVKRRWTEADGAEELTAKQRLNAAEKTASLCFHQPPSHRDTGSSSSSRGDISAARSCFNIQHEFEVVWQAPSPCYLPQVSVFRSFFVFFPMG